MPAHLCEPCEIRYPAVITVCRVCGNNALRYTPVEPSDWERESARLIEVRSNAQRKIPLLKIGAVKDEDGRLWLYSIDMVGGGWSSPVPSFQMFELLDGSIVEVQGRDEAHRRYWVEVLGKSDGGWK